MKLKRFKVRFCVSPERDEQEEIVMCSDEQSAKNIIKHKVAVSSMSLQRHTSIHEVVEIAG